MDTNVPFADMKGTDSLYFCIWLNIRELISIRGASAGGGYIGFLNTILHGMLAIFVEIR
jgi:hypothetical protein